MQQILSPHVSLSGIAAPPRNARCYAAQRRHAPARQHLTVVAGLGDRLLDYIEGASGLIKSKDQLRILHMMKMPLGASLDCIKRSDCAGGPKLRKWYGQGERPTDGGGMRSGSEPAPQLDPEAKRDAVLVTDADLPTGDAAVLQLILAG